MRPVAVGAKDREERAVLEPARVKLLERGIGERVVVGRPVATNVGGPIWSPGQGEIETGRDLVAQAPVGAVDVSRPDGGADALLAQVRRPRKQKDTLTRVLGFPMILHAKRMLEREDVGEFSAIADCELTAAEDGVAHVWPVFFGLGAIKPECIPSLRQQLAGQMLPVDVARLGVGGVVDVRASHELVLCIQNLVRFGFGIEQAPDRDHGVYILFVQGIEIPRYVMIVGIKNWIALGLPPEPILHYCIKWDMLLSIALRDPANLVERHISILGLKEAV